MEEVVTCKQVEKVGTSTWLCSQGGYVYICDECEGNECSSCYKLEKPIQQQINIQEKQNLNNQYSGFDFKSITQMVTTKEFLIGAVIGAVAVKLLFCRR